MKISDLFKQELCYIEDDALKKLVSDCLNDLPEYFIHIGASTSGKHHPAYALGEGGLVRHTKAAVGIAKELIRAELPCFEIRGSEDADIVYAALLLHDGFKCGNNRTETAFDHPVLAAAFVLNKAKGTDIPNGLIHKVCECISSHMGRWNTHADYLYVLPTPKSGLEQLVHICDYLASRKSLEFNFDVSK